MTAHRDLEPAPRELGFAPRAMIDETVGCKLLEHPRNRRGALRRECCGGRTSESARPFLFQTYSSTAFALTSWALTIAPILLLLENQRSVLSSLGLSLRLGKGFTSKLAEINLVLGIVKLALLVVAMVFSAAPLPFSDELGPGAMHFVVAASGLFFLVADDFFHHLAGEPMRKATRLGRRKAPQPRREIARVERIARAGGVARLHPARRRDFAAAWTRRPRAVLDHDLADPERREPRGASPRLASPHSAASSSKLGKAMSQAAKSAACASRDVASSGHSRRRRLGSKLTFAPRARARPAPRRGCAALARR